MTTTVSTSPTTRETIINSALRILQSDGPAALTVRNITDAAGCSTTGIYTHFGGKAGVIEAIFVDGFDSFAAALDGTDLLASGRAYRRWALEHPTQYMVMFGRAVPEFEPSREASARARATYDQLVDGIREETNISDDDAEAWAYHVFATVHGYVMLELSGMTSPADDIAARYERMLTGLLFGAA